MNKSALSSIMDSIRSYLGQTSTCMYICTGNYARYMLDFCQSMKTFKDLVAVTEQLDIIHWIWQVLMRNINHLLQTQLQLFWNLFKVENKHHKTINTSAVHYHVVWFLAVIQIQTINSHIILHYLIPHHVIY